LETGVLKLIKEDCVEKIDNGSKGIRVVGRENEIIVENGKIIITWMNEGRYYWIEIDEKTGELRKGIMNRDILGKIVRDSWIAWAKEQKEIKEKWLVEYEKLDEKDRRIGEAVFNAVNDYRIKLAEKKSRGELSEIEFEHLQEYVFSVLDIVVRGEELDKKSLINAIELVYLQEPKMIMNPKLLGKLNVRK
jgi:hypothetical protein